ncbi:hypothetical protein C5C07_19745 [Haloferax sp. Atlit-4N]|uniref:PH domain-containing protein n=1 Tax=Haloferax sp. Atlit-4N TaxID=2077206 RepID=UPI000E242334|nr:PH domain-containing protein [Haloferax sp. Atlit-4N]RDZ49999.1 hypothetical protein C5C07_19745 [Haloferax sp. Atlit-4N]
MGLFDRKSEDDIILENADLDCEPQGELVSKKHVKKMDEYLDPGEKVHFFAIDAGGKVKIDGENQDGVMNVTTVITNQRVLYKAKKMIGGSQTSIDYKNISSVEISFGVVQKRLNLETDSKVFGIGVGHVERDEVQNMVQFIRQKIQDANNSDNTSVAGQTAGNGENEEGPLDKLERLGELRDQGVVTEDEFQEKKQSLLDQI